MTLFEVAHEISRRLAKIFLRDENGRRPVYGGSAKFQDDPHWRDSSCSTSTSTATTAPALERVTRPGGRASIARLLDIFGRVSGADMLAAEKGEVAERLAQEQAYGRTMKADKGT